MALFKKRIVINVVFALILVTGLYIYFTERDIPFNSEQWQLGSESEVWNDHTDPVRPRMVKDLLARHLLDGKTKAEVKKLLGPDGTENSGGSISYWIDSEYHELIGIDPTRVYTLIIEFDSSQHVKNAYVVS